MKAYLIIIGILLGQLALAQDVSKTSSAITWSLEDCIAYALANNITVRDADLTTDLAEIDYNKAKSSRLPNLFGNASQSFSNGNSIDPITSNFVSDQINSSNWGINSSITLFQGNQLSNQIKQSELLIAQRTYLSEVTKNNIALSILENYLQVLFNKEDVVIAENNLSVSEKEVTQAKLRLDAGQIPLNEYTETQSQAATNRYNLIAAKNRYQQSIIAIKQLLELSPIQEFEVKNIETDMDSINLHLDKNELYAKALNYLPEIKANALSIEISETELSLAKGNYMPTLSLVGSLGSGYTSINNNTFSDQFNVNFNQRIGVSLSVPIFNRNQTKANVNAATINIEKSTIQKQQSEKEVYLKVETAYQNALSTQEQVIASEAAKVAAEQSFKLAQKKYQLGDLSTTDLVVSQNTFTQAQQNYLQAKYLNILYNQLLQFYQGNALKL